MKRFPIALILLSALLLTLSSCAPKSRVDSDALRGLSAESLQEMREEILSRHSDGSPLSDSETAEVELIREQERRLANGWIFGQWVDKHGARLIFRDDGTVSVGARRGAYDEFGIFKFFPSEEPSYETSWSVTYDVAGDPVVMVNARSGETLIYPFHKSRKEVYEMSGDLQTGAMTGFLFTKTQE